MLLRLPDRHGHGQVQVRGAPPHLRRQASPAQSLSARAVTALDPPGHEGAGPSPVHQRRPWRAAGREDGAASGRDGPAPEDGDFRRGDVLAVSYTHLTLPTILR